MREHFPGIVPEQPSAVMEAGRGTNSWATTKESPSNVAFLTKCAKPITPKESVVSDMNRVVKWD